MTKTFFRYKKSFLLFIMCLALCFLPLTTEASSGTVKLASKTMTLKITVKNGKTTAESKQIKLKKSKSVRKVKVTYKSNNPKVAKVSSTGKVKAIKNGKATITLRVHYRHHAGHRGHIKVLKQKVIVKKTVIPKKKEEDSKFHYKHNPELNPKAMEDIIKNDKAIYGFSPNPDSGSLKEYAKFDWTDAKVVADAKKSRTEYHQSIASMYDMLEEMKAQGKSVEEMARAVSQERNRIRIDSYKDNPEGLEALKKRNMEKYGNENGPTPEYLYNQYGSWEIVMQKAFSVNMGMDACCGLYDDYYQLYIDLGLIKDSKAAQPMNINEIFAQIKKICEDHRMGR